MIVFYDTELILGQFAASIFQHALSEMFHDDHYMLQ